MNARTILTPNLTWLHERKSSITQGTWRGPEGSAFPKKSCSILREGDQLTAYRFIQTYHPLFSLRWLFRRMNIYPNAYYNYLAQRKKAYQQQKQRILQKIKDIYHAYNGVPGYRTMQVYLRREGMVIVVQPCISTWIESLACWLWFVGVSQIIVKDRLIKYFQICCSKILQQKRLIISGALILRIYFLAMAASGITVRLLTFMIAV